MNNLESAELSTDTAHDQTTLNSLCRISTWKKCYVIRELITLVAYVLLTQLTYAQESQITIKKHLSDEDSRPSLVINSDTLSSLRGYVEMTYRSKVDGTEQPFTLGIPNHYQAKRDWPLQVYLHGFGGTHQQKLLGKPCKHEFFELYVHGRARGVEYTGLSETDVFEALEVVRTHWKINGQRVHLMGSSMGGFGSLRIGTRFPDRFASIRVLAGSGLGFPLENLHSVPTRALHGNIDHSVPICLGRASINAINAFGGKALIDEFPNVGHSIPSVKRKPAEKWAFNKRLAQNVVHVRYTATDEMARGANWVKVTEWGHRGAPANIDAQIDQKQTLQIGLDNVTTARFDLKLAPVNRNKPLRVIVNTKSLATLKAPLPNFIWVSSHAEPASFNETQQVSSEQKHDYQVLTMTPELPKQRLHFPGGSFALYHGEPLLIVYGTQGDTQTTDHLHEIAKIASRSADGKWPQPGKDSTRSTVYQMTTGRLPIKADRDLSDTDIARFNLLLLGDAEQNSIVGRIADELPVTISEKKIRTNDGISWDFTDRGLGLLYANPLAPKRLIYWIAANKTEFYKSGSVYPLSTMMDYQGSIEAPADFMIMDTKQQKLVAARRFDSRWNWIKGYKDSPILDQSIAAGGPRAVELAEAIRLKMKADFGATTGRDWYSFAFETVPNVTRKIDVAALYYGERVGLLELTGEQLLTAQTAFHRREAKPGNAGSEWFEMSRFVPAIDKEKIDIKQKYLIAFPEWAAFTFGRYADVPTNSLRLTNIYLRDVIDENLN